MFKSNEPTFLNINVTLEVITKAQKNIYLHIPFTIILIDIRGWSFESNKIFWGW